MKLEWGLGQGIFGDGESEHHGKTVAPGSDSSNGIKNLASMMKLLLNTKLNAAWHYQESRRAISLM